MDTSQAPEHDPADDASADHEADDAPVDHEADDDPIDGKDPLRFSSWMKRSATGAVMSGIAAGLQRALEPDRQLPAFVIEASGEPDDDDGPISLQFDPDDPANTVAVVRRPVSEHRREYPSSPP